MTYVMLTAKEGAWSTLQHARRPSQLIGTTPADILSLVRSHVAFYGSLRHVHAADACSLPAEPGGGMDAREEAKIRAARVVQAALETYARTLAGADALQLNAADAPEHESDYPTKSE